MTDRENIRAYIEKLHKEHRGSEGDSIFRRALRTVLFYIDSMQEEPVSKDLETELDKYIKDHFTIEKEQLDRFGIEEKDYMYSMDKSDMLAMVHHFVGNHQEHVSEELEDAAFDYAEACKYEGGEKLLCIEHFKAGAKWQKEHLWKPADGDDLPEYDREVIAILDYDFGHYKVVYAHRPFPDGWNGTNIDTGEKEHFEPVIYDKGGWNQPHVLYWLDAKLPYEENKITK